MLPADARVIDTIFHWLAAPLGSLPAHAAAIGMLAAQTVCNLFIPSESGQAYVTMPIMAPLADLRTRVRRQCGRNRRYNKPLQGQRPKRLIP